MTATASTVSGSVVICAYTPTRWGALQDAAASVRAQTVEAAEIIVVVDNNEELFDLASEALNVDLVLANCYDRGLSGARNTGIEAARGDVVVFLDDDAAAEPDWLQHHLAAYADVDVIGVGGLVVPAFIDPRPRWLPPEFDWVIGCSYVGLPTQAAPVRNPIGANMSFRREPLVAAGGFASTIGRVGALPFGCEETEVAIRLARLHPNATVLHQPAAVVNHIVPPNRASWTYFRTRCWSEGLSKAEVARLSDPRAALGSERRYVSRTIPRGMGRALRDSVRQRDPIAASRVGAALAGVAITAGGYTLGRFGSSGLLGRQSGSDGREGGGLRPLVAVPPRHPSHYQRPHERTMSMNTHIVEEVESPWLYFDVHGRVGIHVAADAPTARQLRTMLACFATSEPVSPDIVVTADMEPMPEAANLENELSYTPDSVLFHDERVQVVRDGAQYRIHGSGELLTALVPILDRAMVERNAAMFHAATVVYNGHALALPAGGGTGKTSTIAKLMRKPGFSFMGDDWAFLSDDGNQLGYAKPMFIKPHHRPIYPHLFAGARKPLVPVPLSKSIGRVTTVVHPYVVRYPRLADVTRRWSPEHRMVAPAQALPDSTIATSAPLALTVYIERYEGARTRLLERDRSWMVDRMIGNFHIEMAGFSQHVVASLGASSVLSQRDHFDDKARVLTRALDGHPCYVLQVPAVLGADQASDDIVDHLGVLVEGLGLGDVPTLVGALP